MEFDNQNKIEFIQQRLSESSIVDETNNNNVNYFIEPKQINKARKIIKTEKRKLINVIMELATE